VGKKRGLAFKRTTHLGGDQRVGPGEKQKKKKENGKRGKKKKLAERKDKERSSHRVRFQSYEHLLPFGKNAMLEREKGAADAPARKRGERLGKSLQPFILKLREGWVS